MNGTLDRLGPCIRNNETTQRTADDAIHQEEQYTRLGLVVEGDTVHGANPKENVIPAGHEGGVHHRGDVHTVSAYNMRADERVSEH